MDGGWWIHRGVVHREEDAASVAAEKTWVEADQNFPVTK